MRVIREPTITLKVKKKKRIYKFFELESIHWWCIFLGPNFLVKQTNKQTGKSFHFLFLLSNLEGEIESKDDVVIVVVVVVFGDCGS